MADKSPSSDLEIARSVPLKDIREIAANYGIEESELTPHGRFMAKVPLSILDRLSDRPDGKYVDVTAINPTPLGAVSYTHLTLPTICSV